MNNLDQLEPLRITAEIVKNSPLIICNCGGVVFSEKMMFRRISAIMSPSGKEELFPMNVIICDSCGKTPTQFNVNGMIPEEFLASKKLDLIG